MPAWMKSSAWLCVALVYLSTKATAHSVGLDADMSAAALKARDLDVRQQTSQISNTLGFISGPNGWAPWLCYGSTSVIGNYLACYVGTLANGVFPTGCSDSSILWQGGSTGTCGPSWSCDYHYIQSTVAASATTTLIACVTDTVRGPIFIVQNTPTSIPSTTTTSTITTTTSTISSTTTTSSSTSTTSSTPIPAPSQAWIAGAVIGGIAGVGIIGLLVWIALILKKRRSNNDTSGPPAGLPLGSEKPSVNPHLDQYPQHPVSPQSPTSASNYIPPQYDSHSNWPPTTYNMPAQDAQNSAAELQTHSMPGPPVEMGDQNYPPGPYKV